MNTVIGRTEGGNREVVEPKEREKKNKHGKGGKRGKGSPKKK